MTPDWIAELRNSLPAERISTDPDVLSAHSHDEAGLVPVGTPVVLVRPQSTEEVRSVLRLANAHRVPVVPRGAGTGLAGGANAVDGCIILSLAKMNRILEIDPHSMLAVVEPGVVNAALDAAAREFGLWYPPDPASWESSTLGGNIATNAGGLCCVKYGVTRDSVLGLEVVLASGEVIRTGARTLKNVAGYDLTALFIGSEGTLGVVTEATLRLRPRRPPAKTVAAFFPTLEAAGTAILDIVAHTVPSLLELIDRITLRAVEEMEPMDLDTDSEAMLFARSDAGGEQGQQEIARIAAACEQAGASYVAHAETETEGQMLLAARRLCYPALEKRGATLLDDVGVPIARIPDLLRSVQEIAGNHDVLIGTFGHAGDGNMHPTIVFDANDAEETKRALAAFDDIVRETLALGGTVTGEHGVGLLKTRYLAAQYGEASLQIQKALKDALDPRHILNPGKVV